jgi:hypothetical protein
MKHGPIWAPVQAFLAAIVVAGVGRIWERYGDFPMWLPLFVATIGAVAEAYLGMRRGTPQRNVMFRMACWAFPAVWIMWIFLMGWSPAAVLIFAGACLGASLLAPLLATPDPDPTPEGPKDDTEAELRRLIVKFASVRQTDIPTVRKLRDWTPLDAGSTYVVKAARGSNLGWEKLQDIQLDLSTALDLPVGCPVEASPGPLESTQGETHLKVSTRNYLYVPIDYPTDYSPLTVVDDFAIGRHLDASDGCVELYQSSGLVVSQRGAGKTMLLQNMTASAARMRDCLVWHIDLNNGSMSASWMMTTAEGTTTHPVLDWVAVTAEDALKMAKAGIRIAKRRRARYASQMVRNNETVLVPSASLPAIVIIVDEAAEVTGDQAGPVEQKVSAALQELQRIGRAMLVNVVFSSLRGTGDYIPAAIKKQVGFSVCGRVKDQAELAFVFDWDNGISVRQLVTKGQFFYQRDGGPVKTVKAFRLLPRQIVDICVAVQSIRAGVSLDPPSVDAAGADYRERQQTENYNRWLAHLRGEDDEFGEILSGAAAFSDDDDGGGGYADDDDDIGALGDEDDALGDLMRDANDLKRAGTPTRQRKPSQPKAPQLPPSGTSNTEEIVDDFLNELDAWPGGTISEGERFRPADTTRSAGPAPLENTKAGPAVRRALIEQLLEAAGAAGMKTEEIAVVLGEKWPSARNRQRTNEDLEKMRDEFNLVTQVNPRVPNARAMWWLVRNV